MNMPSKIFASLFLVLLVGVSFFALSSYILKAAFCPFNMNMLHSGRLCDIVNQLSEHNFFGSAIFVLLTLFFTLFVQFLALSARKIEPAFGAYTPQETKGFFTERFFSWLIQHYNSPNMLKALG